MKSYQLDRSVTELGDNFKHVKYTYKYVADDEVITKKPKAKPMRDFVEIGRCQTPLYDNNGKVTGWIAEHLYQRKVQHK